MEDLQRAAHKVRKEGQVLRIMLDGLEGYEDDGVEYQLILAQAKRVKRDVTILVRALAQKRDELQP